MNKAEVIDAMAQNLGSSKAESERALHAFCEAVPFVRFPIDNESFFYELRLVLGVAPKCVIGAQGLDEVQLVRVDTQQNELVIGYLRERCNGVQRDRSETCPSFC